MREERLHEASVSPHDGGMERRVAGAVGIRVGALLRRYVPTAWSLWAASTSADVPVGAASSMLAPASSSRLADSTSPSRAANSSGVKPPSCV